jgi:Concanavalin A-like lectin/glucanases superfamily
MSQIAVPISDISTGQWTQPVWSRINGPSENDANPATSSANPVNDAFEVALAQLQWPQSGGEVVAVRLRKTDSGSVSVQVTLLQGTKIIATRTYLPSTTFSYYYIYLNSSEVSRITDFGALRLQVVAGATLFGLDLNGTSQYVNFGLPTLFSGLAACTFSCWINIAAFPVYTPAGLVGLIFGQCGPGPSSFGNALSLSYTQLLSFSVTNNGAPGIGISTSSISTGTLYHVVGTYDGSTVKLYINGSLVISNSYSGTLFDCGYDWLAGAYFPFGGTTPNGCYNGTITAIRLYNAALSDEEVTEIYGNGLGLAIAGSAAEYLIGWWKFDEGSGATVADSSGYGNNGTLVNSPNWVPGNTLG